MKKKRKISSEKKELPKRAVYKRKKVKKEIKPAVSLKPKKKNRMMRLLVILLALLIIYLVVLMATTPPGELESTAPEKQVYPQENGQKGEEVPSEVVIEIT